MNRDDVLSRPELRLDDNINPRHLSTEGSYPDNHVLSSDGGCYIPVIYKAQRFKLKIIIKNKGAP